MSTWTGVPNVMAFIERIPLITVADGVVKAFQEKNVKWLLEIMIRECVKQWESLLMTADDVSVEESKKLHTLLGQAYGKLALAAGVNPIEAIAYRAGISKSIQVVDKFPARYFDYEEFQELFRYAESLLIRYTWSPNHVQNNVDALLSKWTL